MKKSKLHILPIGIFLEKLKETGFAIGIDTYFEVQQVYTELLKTDQLDKLHNVLCPVLAKNEKQQKQFNSFFDEFYSIVDYDLFLKESKERENQNELGQTDKKADKTDDKEHHDNKSDNKKEKYDEIDTTNQKDTEKPNNQKLNDLVAQSKKGHKPPYVYNISIEKQKLHLSDDIFRVSGKMRYKEDTDEVRLNIEQTIHDTIKNFGFISPAYQTNSRHIEFLMLIDWSTERNHQAQLYDIIYREFKRNNLYIDRFFFDSDPRVCWNENYPKGIKLEHLQLRHPEAFLLYFSKAEDLIYILKLEPYKWTEIIKEWKRRVLFTPEPTADWGRREQILLNLFPYILPATTEGILEIHKYFSDTRELETTDLKLWKDQSNFFDTEIYIEEHVDILEYYYSSKMIEWIAACAVYPELKWDLTLYLGHLLSTESNQLVTQENLIQLNRLNWFREGKIPEKIRFDLLKKREWFPKESELKVRKAISDLLMRDAGTIDKNTYAYNEFLMNLVFNELLLNNENIESENLKKLLDNTPIQDYVSLAYLTEKNNKNTNFRIDNRLAEILQEKFGIVAPQVKIPSFFRGLENSIVEIKKSGSSRVGFVISAQGHILTCSHNISKGENTIVKFFIDNTIYEAKTIKIDHSQNIAIILLQSNMPRITPLKFSGYSITNHTNFVTYGFSNNKVERISSRVVSILNNKLDLDIGDIQPNMLGAPLLNPETNAVVGLIQDEKQRRSWYGNSVFTTYFGVSSKAILNSVNKNNIQYGVSVDELSLIKSIEKKIGIKLDKGLFQKVTERPIRKSYEIENDKVTALSLYRCGLKKIPEEVYELQNLKFLDLRNNLLSSLPERIFELGLDIRWGNNEKAYWGILLAGNPFSKPLIKAIEAGNNTIKNWFQKTKSNDKEIIKALEKELNCSFTQDNESILKYFQKDKEDSRTIYSLDENNNVDGLCIINNLTEIPEAITELKHLTKLNLSHNRIKDISILAKIEKLSILDLSDNEIDDLTPIGNLTLLKGLYLSDNNISDISPLRKLTIITGLNIDKNQIEDITPLSNLTIAKGFNLAYNKIKDLSPLSELSNLEELWLHNNRTESIDALKNLKKLTKLELQYNPIQQLPEWITDLRSEIVWQETVSNADKFIVFYKNPLEAPPKDIVKKGKRAVKKWFQKKSLEKEIDAAIKRIPGFPFIENYKLLKENKSLAVYYYNSYENYQSQTKSKLSFEEYRNYFNADSSIEKIFMIEPIRLLREIDELEEIYFQLPFGVKIYELIISISQIEDYFSHPFEMIKDKQNWIYNFIDTKAYNKKIRNRFFKDLVKITTLKPPQDKGIYLAFSAEKYFYPINPHQTEVYDKSIYGTKHYTDTITTILGEDVVFDFWADTKQKALKVEISRPELVETKEEDLVKQFQEWLDDKQKPKQIEILETKLNTIIDKAVTEVIFEAKTAAFSEDEKGRIVGLALPGLDISPVKEDIFEMANLEELNLSLHELKDISFLRKLIKLKKLNLSHNKIEDISSLPKAPNLTYLNLNANSEISDISKLNFYKNLELLLVSGNSIENIEVLTAFKKLKTLSVLDNQIQEISPLSQLFELEYLNAGENLIDDISSLKPLNKLKTLGLHGCPLKYIPEWLYDTDMEFKTEETDDNKLIEGRIHLNKQDNLMFPPFHLIEQGKQAVKQWYKETMFVKVKGEKVLLPLYIDEADAEKGKNDNSYRYDGQLETFDGKELQCSLNEDPIEQAENVYFYEEEMIESSQNELLEQFQKWLDIKHAKQNISEKISFTLIDETIKDIPTYTQTERYYLTEGTFKKEQFEERVREMADILKSNKKYARKEQNKIYFRFYDKESRSNDNWFALFRYNKSMKEDGFSYNDVLMKRFHIEDDLYTVPNTSPLPEPKQFNSILDLFEAHNNYSISKGTLKVISDNHFQISDLEAAGQNSEHIIDDVKRSLIDTVLRVFIHTNSQRITLTAVPLKITDFGKREDGYFEEFSETISITAEQTLQILRKYYEISNFKDLVETDNNDSRNKIYHNILFKDMNTIWKDFEKYLIDYLPNYDPNEMPWEKAAKDYIKRLLSDAKWDYEKKVITVYEYGMYETTKEFDKLQELLEYLENEAEGEAINHMPSEDDMHEMARERFSDESMVDAVINDKQFSKKLKRLGWL